MEQTVHSVDVSEYVIENDDGSLFMRYLERELYKRSGKRSATLFRTLRIVRIIDGEAQWRIGSKIYHVQKDTVMILNNITWRVLLDVMTEKVHTESIEFMPTFVPGVFSCLNLFFAGEDSSRTVQLEGKSAEQIRDYFVEIRREMSSPGPLCTEYLKGQLISMIVLLNRYFTEKGNMFAKPDGISALSESVTYIWNNISSDISIEELSKRVHMSRSHFTSLFKKYYGLSVAAYIRQCRVLNVIQLIKWNKINIIDAAFQSGFTSSSGFYKTFNGVTGMTPREYLKNI